MVSNAEKLTIQTPIADQLTTYVIESWNFSLIKELKFVTETLEMFEPKIDQISVLSYPNAIDSYAVAYRGITCCNKKVHFLQK